MLVSVVTLQVTATRVMGNFTGTITRFLVNNSAFIAYSEARRLGIAVRGKGDQRRIAYTKKLQVLSTSQMLIEHMVKALTAVLYIPSENMINMINVINMITMINMTNMRNMINMIIMINMTSMIGGTRGHHMIYAQITMCTDDHP